MNHAKQIIDQSIFPITLALILLLAFILRAVNLNYNSPYNDEAIYIVVGRMGVFQGDWWTYNASGWMAGQPFVYPPLSAIAYQSFGILGSRFLNVILGVLAVEAVFVLTFLLSHSDNLHNYFNSLIAAVIIAFSTVTLYVSRLATYDILSYYLLLLSLIFLIYNEKKGVNLGLNYFAALVFLTLSFLAKITIGLYVPLVFLYSFYQAKNIGDNSLYYWKRYFGFPLVGFLSAYILYNFGNLRTYFLSQTLIQKNTISEIFTTIWRNTKYLWPLYAVASLTLIAIGRSKIWAGLTFSAFIILVFHIVNQRVPTLDKHIYLLFLFLAPLIGIGLGNFIERLFKSGFILGSISTIVLMSVLVIYSVVNYRDIDWFNTMWRNSDEVLTYLNRKVQTGDKVLAEVGASAILATYDNNYPINTTTFDWFEYKNKSGYDAYISAIRDGYFKYIELDSPDISSVGIHSSLHNTVLANLNTSYAVDFHQDDFVVYKRQF